jgi:hypothetical protein
MAHGFAVVAVLHAHASAATMAALTENSQTVLAHAGVDIGVRLFN